jgi:hypothetical protein
MDFLSKNHHFFKVLAVAATRCVNQYRYSVLEIFGMGVYSIEIYIFENIHNYSGHF